MKNMKFLRWVRGTAATVLLVIITFACASANAAHEMIYAVDQNNNLINFYSDTPGTIINAYSINGIYNAEEIRGIDYWGGTIFGLGSFGELYTLNPNNGAATMVGTGFGVVPNGATFGSDNGPAGMVVVSSLGQNLLVNRTTGLATVMPSLFYAAGDPFAGQTPRVDAVAYDNATGTWYADDTLQNTLATLDPTTGQLSTIGPNGIDASRFNGLDISPDTGIMYMGTPQASSDPQANFYTVSELTGAVGLVGQIDVPTADTMVRGVTVVPEIPEPSSVALLALGAVGLLFVIRRQR